MSQQICPLCGTSAQFSTTGQPAGKRFSCKHCIGFWIDEYAEGYLSNLPEVTLTEFRKRLSESAKKSAPGYLYVIREPKGSEITGDGHGVARTVLKTEWVDLAG